MRASGHGLSYAGSPLFLNGINLYGKFEVEVDGAFGPCEQLALRPACLGKA